MTRTAGGSADAAGPGDRFEPFVVVRASAGTGKTHALSTRMIRLLADGVEPDEIFAATFARKAAGEILARVLERLAEAADSAEPAAAPALAGAIGRPDADAAFFRALLTRVANAIDRLAIGTLDAFFVRCADAARYDLGLPPGFGIGSEPDLLLLRRRAIRATVEDALRDDARGASSPAATLAALMVQLSGGAATAGIESKIEEIVKHLAGIHRDADPAAWDWLPLPKRPASEALDAAIESLRAIAFADGRFASARDAALEAVAGGDWERLVSKGLVAAVLSGEPTYYRKPIPEEAIPHLRTLGDLGKWALAARVAAQTRAIRDLLDHYSAVAERMAREEGIVSFDDVTRLVGTAAGDGTLDAARWRGIRYPSHILLDEFQDTSPAQWRVLERLAEHAVDTSGSFFAVGDGKQAIYGWRGGAAELFDSLEDAFADVPGGLARHDLAESWRSGPAVLESVNRVFARLPDSAALPDHTHVTAAAARGFPKHVPAPRRREMAGWVRLRTCAAPPDPRNGSDTLLAAVATRAAALSSANPGSVVGVLVRTNKAAERVIARLKSAGIVAGAEGGQPLDDSPAVALVLSGLHFIDHPGDSAARFHVGTSPLAAAFGLDASGARADDPPAACVERIDELRRALIDEGHGPVVARLAATLSDHGSPRDRRRLEQLVAAAWRHDEERPGDAGLARTEPFVEACREVPVVDPVAAPIRVMTIHKAKGLEFDIVVLSDLDRRIVAHPPRLDVDRAGPLEPVKRVLVHTAKECRSVLPPDWQEVCDAASDPVVREAIATLYVGMTRASRALEIVILPESPSEKKLPATLAAVLRTTLPEEPRAAPEAILWRAAHGADPDDDRLPGSTEGPAPAPPPVALPGPIRLRPTAGRGRGGKVRTPSSAEGGRRVAAATLLDPGSRAALGIGTLLHAWIERVGWPAVLPDDDVLRTVAGPDPAIAPQLDALLADFRRMCAAPAVAALLAEPTPELPARFVGADLPAGPAVPHLAREQSFAIDDGGETLLGIMDRLVVWRRDGVPVAAAVVDFKFDGMGGPDADAAVRAAILAEKTAFYAPQLLAYRKAAAALHRLPPSRVSLTLAFMRSGDVVDVEG